MMLDLQAASAAAGATHERWRRWARAPPLPLPLLRLLAAAALLARRSHRLVSRQNHGRATMQRHSVQGTMQQADEALSRRENLACAAFSAAFSAAPPQLHATATNPLRPRSLSLTFAVSCVSARCWLPVACRLHRPTMSSSSAAADSAMIDAAAAPSRPPPSERFRFSIDRGGTFTDVVRYHAKDVVA